MPTAVDIWNHFGLAHTQTAVYTVDTFGALSLVGNQLARHQNMAAQSIRQTVNGQPPVGNLGVAQIATDLTAIQTLTKNGGAASYRAVKDDYRWQRIYQRAAANLNVMNAAGAVVPRAYAQTYPCHYCGIILPETLIQVDHRQPQATPWIPVVKCLRMIGNNYTNAPGKGTKAGQFAALVALGTTPGQAAVNLANLNQAAPDKRGEAPFFFGFDSYAPTDNNNGTLHPGKEDRYTLTDAGRTLLSCGMSYFGVAGFRDMCVNNLLNLVPACAQCNGNGDMGKGSIVYARNM